MKINLGTSDDYAIVCAQGAKRWEEDTTKISFYYGYEETENNEEDGEWLFVVKKNSKIIKTYTTTQLEDHANNRLRSTAEYLLIGIYMYLQDL